MDTVLWATQMSVWVVALMSGVLSFVRDLIGHYRPKSTWATSRAFWAYVRIAFIVSAFGIWWFEHQALNASKTEFSEARNDWSRQRTEFLNRENVLLRDIAKPPPKPVTTAELRVIEDHVYPTDRKDAPHLLDITIQTNKTIQPVRLRITLSGPAALFGSPPISMMMEAFHNWDGYRQTKINDRTYEFRWTTPYWIPRYTVSMSFGSDSEVHVTKAELLRP